MARQAIPQDLRDVRLHDPAAYEDPGPMYRRLREDAPVFWCEPLSCWVVSKYEDVKYVCSADEDFSVAFGATIGPQLGALRQIPLPDDIPGRLAQLLKRRDAIARRANATADSEHLLRVDPPRHTMMRTILRSSFTPRAVGGLEEFVRAVTHEAFASIEPNSTKDFVAAIALPIPLYTIARLLGVRLEDRDNFKQWTDVILQVNDGSFDPKNDGDTALDSVLAEMYSYFAVRIGEARTQATEDLVGTLASRTIADEPLSDGTIQTLCRMLLVGGNETTRHLMSGAALALAQHPEQRALLAVSPELMSGAIEEFLRWVTPVRHICRTTKKPIELRGETIEAGEYVMALLGSANRDEEVWKDADVFNVTRPVQPMHLAFTYGTHMCLGQHVTRLETRIVFENLLARFPAYSIAGDIRRRPMLLLNGIEEMPIRFAA